MDKLVINQSGDLFENCTASIQQMPDTILELDLRDLSAISWNGSPIVQTFDYRSELSGLMVIYDGLVLPSCTAVDIRINVSSVLGEIDLSHTRSESFYLYSDYTTGPILWPEGVDSIRIDAGLEQVTYWPMSLRKLDIWGAEFSCIPTLPDGLELLVIQNTPNLDCLPNWPASLTPQNFYTELWEPGFEQFCSVLNTNCPGIYPGITGSIFADLNSNGDQDSGEFRPAGATILLQPGNTVIPCEADGSWEVGLAPGTYTITPSASYPYLQSFAPTEHTADV
ncbi:MAG TPA: hypothetical protein PLO57_08390, partial [Candidatus Cloacimonadota bacterium]|nr:hypothetical protein [Candidatus Cloacimonadota bacterium]